MKRQEITERLERLQSYIVKVYGSGPMATELQQVIDALKAPQIALVVREGELGGGGILRVILTPQVPEHLGELCAYGCQCADEIGPDECDTAEEVEAIFNDMNPPDEEEDDEEEDDDEDSTLAFLPGDKCPDCDADLILCADDEDKVFCPNCNSLFSLSQNDGKDIEEAEEDRDRRAGLYGPEYPGENF